MLGVEGDGPRFVGDSAGQLDWVRRVQPRIGVPVSHSSPSVEQRDMAGRSSVMTQAAVASSRRSPLPCWFPQWSGEVQPIFRQAVPPGGSVYQDLF